MTLHDGISITADMWVDTVAGTNAATLTYTAGTPATLALNIEDLGASTTSQHAGTLTINAGSLDLAFTAFTKDANDTYASFVFTDTNDGFTTDDITKVTRSAAGVYTINNAGVTSVTTGSVLLTGTTTGIVSAGTKRITAGAQFTGATVSSSAISGVANGDSVAVTDTGSANTTITTAALAIGDAVTINGNQITFTGAAQTGVTISAYADGDGVASLTNVAAGTHLAWTAAPTTKSMTVNSSQYMIDSTGTAPQIEVTASGTTLTAGTALIGTNRPSAVNTTREGISIGIQSGTAEVVTAVGTATDVNALAMGSTLTAYAAGIDVVTAAAGTKETGSVTVNGTTYYQGFSSTNTVTRMSFLTTSTGSRLTNGDAYLNGSGSIVVSNAAGTATSTITSTNGDITISTNGATVTVADLDNGDSFTVTEGSVSKTYTVSNGVLFDSDGNTRPIFDASDPTFGNVAVTAATNIGALTTTATFVTNATAGVNWNSSHGSLAPTLDVTSRNLGVGTDSSVVATPINVTQYANGSYLHANGVVDTNSTNAIGTLNSTTDGTFTYTATSTNGQTINLNQAAAADNGTWQITGTSAGDRITGNGLGSTLNGGAGNDTITANAVDYAEGGDGNDELTAAANNVTLSGGTGADTLTAVALATGTTTLTGGDGADVFVINDGTTRSAVITDFDFANDVLYDNQVAASSNFASITSAQVNADGGINLSGGTATVNATNGAYFAQVRGNDNRKQAIGWVGEAATAIDATSMTSGAVIIGNSNTEGDSLYGGSGGDTIYGGANDTVYGGAGRNFVTLSGAATDTMHVLGFGVDNASTHDVVSGFTTGFEAENSDKLILVGGVTTVSTSLTGAGAAGQLTIKSGSSDLIMRNVNVNGTTGAAEVRVGDDSKVAFVASGSVATVSSASYADMYFGTKSGSVKSGLSFANIEDSLEVNLSDSKYTNIASVTGGTGNTSLLGGADAETLISAGGNTSLYGGAGKDVLVGRTTAADTFFALDGIGADTVSGFEGYTENTAETADTVYLSSVSAAKLGSNGITLNLNDSDKLVLTGTGVNANTEVRFTTDGTTFGIAKIGSVAGGNNFTYAKEVTYYGGGNGNDTLTFSSGDSDDHQVWLDGSKGVSYSKVNIINGASASGSLELAGDSAKNTITGGSGDDSLWGGSGNTADRLTGNSGANTFFYGLGEGKDTLVSSSADDTVNLYNINLSDVMSGEITNAGVTVNMNDGSTLTVATSRDIKFNLASGESYIANHSTKQWDNA